MGIRISKQDCRLPSRHQLACVSPPRLAHLRLALTAWGMQRSNIFVDKLGLHSHDESAGVRMQHTDLPGLDPMFNLANFRAHSLHID
eukprot:3697721-Pyramimonas_sp.AAC.1